MSFTGFDVEGYSVFLSDRGGCLILFFGAWFYYMFLLLR